MSREATTTVQIFRSDLSKLIARFGRPVNMAVKRMLDSCPHPEDDRTYLAAEVPGEGNDCLREGSNQTVNGFYCATCKQYIFPKRN